MIGRPRFGSIRFLGLLVALSVLASCDNRGDGGQRGTPEPVPMPDRPDLFVIVLDSLRADALEREVATKPVMPNLRDWSKHRLVFSRAQASSSSTPTSVSAMLSSLPVPSFGGDFLRGIPAGATSVAELLKDAGYRTLAYSANPNCNVSLGHDRGFDTFVEAFSSLSLATGQRLREDHPARIVEPGDLMQAVLDELDPPPVEPVFVYLHVLQPHAPYTPPHAHRRLFVGPQLHEVPLDLPTLARADARGEIPAAWNEPLRRHYDGHVHWTDQALGVFLRALGSHERYSRAGILILSDHGEGFGEHARILHNTTTYEEMIRIPLILDPPGAGTVPGRVDVPVDLIDVAPTLCAFAGVEPARTFQGLDLLAVARDPALGLERRLLSVSIRPDTIAIRHGDHKLIRDLESGKRDVLYDLEANPEEDRDLSSERPGLAESLASALDAELERLDSLGVGRAEPRSLEEEQLETLRSLGYVIGEESP